MNREDLNQKVWYRTLKAFFVFIFGITLIGSFALVIEISKHTTSVVRCDNGKEFRSEYFYMSDENKLSVYKECDIAAYFYSKSEIDGAISKEKKVELNERVLQMVGDGNLEYEIQTFVNEFKSKNVEPRDPMDVGKRYTVEEIEAIYGHSLSESFKVKGKSLVPNFKVEQIAKYNLLNLIKFQALFIMGILTVFWLLSRIFFYISIRERFFKLI